jgi:DNA repair and recombination protein RAD54 and RAD54-like protein
VRNWANELDKWLGKGTITTLAIDGKGGKQELEREIRAWCEASGRNVVKPGTSRSPQLTIVMIVSYESLRLNISLLGQAPIGLMLCDEGHRLKNGDSQTFTALSSLNVQRRVILSGTPIQNDLTEYYSLLSFANPKLLGTRQEFRQKYELAILKGRDASASEQDRAKGDEKLADLLATVNKFIIRRTNDILSKYLPVKYEHVVFIQLSDLQRGLYKHFVTSPEITKLLRGKGSQPLKAIGMLKKLCNHPELLDLEKLDYPGPVPEKSTGRGAREVDASLSGKMAVLERMLFRIRSDTNDKIVLISNYTQTLDLFERMCRTRRCPTMK